MLLLLLKLILGIMLLPPLAATAVFVAASDKDSTNNAMASLAKRTHFGLFSIAIPSRFGAGPGHVQDRFGAGSGQIQGRLGPSLARFQDAFGNLLGHVQVAAAVVVGARATKPSGPRRKIARKKNKFFVYCWFFDSAFASEVVLLLMTEMAFCVSGPGLGCFHGL